MTMNRSISFQLRRNTVLSRSFAPACSPFIRHNSTTTNSIQEPIKPDAIPQDLLVEPPPFTSEAVIEAVHSLGTLRDLGLGKLYTAPGILQNLLEFVHVSTGFAWIASIAVASIMIRVTLFPLMIKSIRNTSKLAVINPIIKRHMAELTQANKEGDTAAASQAQMSIQKLFKDHNVQPLMSILPVFIQMPVFIFFYYALNGMVQLPVPGMETGGLFWFTDLTAGDPRHILPLATSIMTLINFEIGAEVGASQGSTMNPAVKMLFRGLMCVVPYFTWNFPTAIFGFWFTSSLFSLIQGFVFRSPAMRMKLKLPPLAPRVETSVPMSTAGTANTGTSSSTTPALTGGFWKNFNETVQGMKDMKKNIADKAQAAAAKQRALEEAKPKVPTKFEDMSPKLQQRKLRQQERYATSKKRKQAYSTIARRAFSSTAYVAVDPERTAVAQTLDHTSIKTDKPDDEFGLQSIQGTLLEDMTSLTLDELHAHRELRQYYRKIVYELPSLTEYTKDFIPPSEDRILQFRFTTFFGEDHPSASKVVMRVDVRKLGLGEGELLKLKKLAGSRIDHNTQILKMSSERFNDPAQNRKYLSDTLDKLIKEAKDMTDTFEDIPLDTRHSDRKLKHKRPKFPKSWNRPQDKAIEAPGSEVVA